MKDIIYISSAPWDEPCAQVGSENYASRAKRECTSFINQIRRALGTEPEGASLIIKGSQHDFGTYYGVVCYFDDKIPTAVAYAYECESSPHLAEWDDIAKKELSL